MWLKKLIWPSACFKGLFKYYNYKLKACEIFNNLRKTQCNNQLKISFGKKCKPPTTKNMAINKRLDDLVYFNYL